VSYEAIQRLELARCQCPALQSPCSQARQRPRPRACSRPGATRVRSAGAGARAIGRGGPAIRKGAHGSRGPQARERSGRSGAGRLSARTGRRAAERAGRGRAARAGRRAARAGRRVARAGRAWRERADARGRLFARTGAQRRTDARGACPQGQAGAQELCGRTLRRQARSGCPRGQAESRAWSGCPTRAGRGSGVGRPGRRRRGPAGREDRPKAAPRAVRAGPGPRKPGETAPPQALRRRWAGADEQEAAASWQDRRGAGPGGEVAGESAGRARRVAPRRRGPSPARQTGPSVAVGAAEGCRSRGESRMSRRLERRRVRGARRRRELARGPSRRRAPRSAAQRGGAPAGRGRRGAGPRRPELRASEARRGARREAPKGTRRAVEIDEEGQRDRAAWRKRERPCSHDRCDKGAERPTRAANDAPAQAGDGRRREGDAASRCARAVMRSRCARRVTRRRVRTRWRRGEAARA
jgi:hypothetical protein